MEEEITQGSENLREMTLDEKMDYVRVQIKNIAGFVENEKNSIIRAKFESEKVNWGEVIANLILSYRHLEDASMRIGKVKQALNEGESIYDKNVVGTPETQAVNR